MQAEIEIVTFGEDAKDARPGDFILCHRRGLASALIRAGEKLRLKEGHWSHAALIETPTTIIEALTEGVTRNPLSVYRHIKYAIVRTHLNDNDAEQAVAFARSCLGQRYGWGTILGEALHFLTPGKGFWFGMDGTEICSGMVAQAQCRGPAIFPTDPGSMTPDGLELFYKQFIA